LLPMLRTQYFRRLFLAILTTIVSWALFFSFY
jgi:hypothetical protein